MVYFVMLANLVSDKLKAKSERGATMVEYGLIVALIALAAIAGVTLLGTNLQTLFNNIAGRLTGGGGGA